MLQPHRYRFFEQYCLRTPLFPVRYFSDLTNKEFITNGMFQEIWNNTVVKEAIFLASPSLYHALEKNFESAEPQQNKATLAIHLAFLKYISRMSSRSTPFGLFAGCSIGKVSNHTHIKLTNPTEFKRQTGFDMNFLVALSQQLVSDKKIKEQLLFYPNTSLYKAGKHLRYIEYTYQNNQRVHSIEAISETPYLQKILSTAYTGEKVYSLANSIVSNEISYKEARVFIDELIANQILVSELEPSISGNDFLEQLLVKLEQLDDLGNFSAIVTSLKLNKKRLNQLDNTLGNEIALYTTIKKDITNLHISFENKYLFQTDLFTKTTSNTLSVHTLKSIKKGLVFLNKITPKETHLNLKRFREAFTNRYGTQEIPLALALDTEKGIGYIQDNTTDTESPLLDDLVFLKKETNQAKVALNAIQTVLYNKLHQNLKNEAYILSLTDKDVSDFSEDWQDLQDTISMLAEILVIDQKETIYLQAAGGSTATNFIARFCNGDKKTQAFAKSIIAVEKANQKGKIIAEIVHLPQARTGNILKRPVFRAYEIPYLGKSNLPLENQIGIQDLMLSVRDNRIFLRSKKYNKEVVPRLSNAHNYHTSSLPIYHFLCDMQSQDVRRSVYFSWGALAKNYPFLPRVVYDNIILSKARWLIQKEDVKKLHEVKNKPKKLLLAVNEWKNKWKIPQFIQLIENDNKLLVNLKNATSVQMLLATIVKREEFELQEFLFAKEGVVQSTQGYYTNEVIIAFKKEV